MTTRHTIRIGFIGAGGIARQRHLPNLAAMADVQVQAVANRSEASARKVAQAFDIPEALDDWRLLIQREDLDAIFIGTYPYTHEEMSVAALQAGKHVFCQARMAMDLAQAKRMVAAAEAAPRLVHMVCPPPHRMPYEPFIRDAVASGRLGQITSIQLRSVNGANLQSQTLSWREDAHYSGKQILAMGIWAETLNAFFGPYEQLSAYLATPIPTKKDQQGQEVAVRIPQVVQIAGRLDSGALIHEYHSGVVADTETPGDVLIVHGTQGTMRWSPFKAEPPMIAPPGGAFQPADVPESLKRDWHVEEDFIGAVRQAMAGEPWSLSPDFHEALRYMQKVEAVHASAQSGQAINPSEL